MGLYNIRMAKNQNKDNRNAAVTDEGSKSLFHNKDLMAEMLIGFTDEFKDMDREEVVKYINLNPSDDSVRDLNGEMSLPNSGLIRLDTLIDATVPGTDRMVRVRFNIECQMDFRPGYDLNNRAQYYASMLLATQNRNLPSIERYKKLSKVYTVWLCLNCGDESLKGTVSRYEVMPSQPRPDETPRYTLRSLSEIVMVCLDDGVRTGPRGKENPSDSKIVRILNTIFMGKMTDNERQEVLQQKYKIELDLSVIKEVTVLTDLLKEEFENGVDVGKAEGKAEGRIEQCVETILRLIREENFSRDTAIRYGNVPEDCREQVLSELERRLGTS